jgi:hypothetical protein
VHCWVLVDRAFDFGTEHVLATAKNHPTKQDRALEIYRDFAGQSKDNVIAKIREQLDMSPAGATTYYYNAKKLAGH